MIESQSQKEKLFGMSDEELFEVAGSNRWPEACMLELARRSIGEYRDIFRKANNLNTMIAAILVVLTFILLIK